MTAGWRSEARATVEAELAKHVKVGPGPEHEYTCSYCHNGFGYGRWPCAIVRALEPTAADLGRALDALDTVLALHAPEDDGPHAYCAFCSDYRYPCPTVRAIQGDGT